MTNAAHPSKVAFTQLRDGNRRFIEGNRSVETLLSQKRMAELAQNGQKPFAIVLTCSDSRSPVEMIFDQGVGDLFVVRVAGNVVAPSLLASIEFAAANFGSPLVLVLGHSLCGAVNATVKHLDNPTTALPSPHLEELVGRITPAVEIFSQQERQGAEGLHRCTVENVKRSMRLIVNQSSIIRNLVASEKLEVMGGVLDISTGRVQFLQEM